MSVTVRFDSAAPYDVVEEDVVFAKPAGQPLLAQPGSDDNVPAAITDALVQAYEKAGGRIERVRFPGAAHSFIQRPGADTDKYIALMREFVAECVREIEERSA